MGSNLEPTPPQHNVSGATLVTIIVTTVYFTNVVFNSFQVI